MKPTGTACVAHRDDLLLALQNWQSPQTHEPVWALLRIGSWAGLLVPGVPSFSGPFPLTTISHIGDGPRCFPNQVRGQGSASLPACKACGPSQRLLVSPSPEGCVSGSDPQVRGGRWCGCCQQQSRNGLLSHTHQVLSQEQGPPVQGMGPAQGLCLPASLEMPALPQV